MDSDPGHNDSQSWGPTLVGDIQYAELIPYFSGEGDKGISASEFFSNVDDIVETVNWKPRILKQILRTKFRGSALQFFRDNPRIRETTDYETIKAVMTDKFGSLEARGNPMSEFFLCHQFRQEKVIDFSIRLESLRANINVTDRGDRGNYVGTEALKKVFLDGLSDKIQDRMIVCDPATYEEVVKLAVRIEDKLTQSTGKYKSTMLCESRDNDGIVARLSDLRVSSEVATPYAPYSKLPYSETNRKARVMTQDDTVAVPDWVTVPHDRSKSLAPPDRKSKFRDTSIKSKGISRPLKLTKLTVKILIRRDKLTALLDLASDVSLLSSDVVSSMGLGKALYEGPVSKIMGTAGGSFVASRYVDLRFKLENTDDVFCHTYLAVDRECILGFDAIIGSDFLIANNASIDVMDDQLFLNGERVSRITKVESIRKSSALSTCIIIDDKRQTHSWEWQEKEQDIMDQAAKIITDKGDTCLNTPEEMGIKSVDIGTGFAIHELGYTSNCSIVEPVHTSLALNISSAYDGNGRARFHNRWREGSAEMTRLLRAAGTYKDKYDTFTMRAETRLECLKSLSGDAEVDDASRSKLLTILSDFIDVFAIDTKDVGLIKGWTHRVEVSSLTPVNGRQYNVAESLKSPMAGILASYLEAGIIEPSSSPWNCPLVIRKKKGGGHRLVLDAQEINKITRRIDYPMRDLKAILSDLAGFTVFTTIDLESGYHQVALSRESRQLYSFRTPWGKFQYTRLPMGATNSGLFFQRVMENILAGVSGPNVIIFQDDIMIATKNIDEHVEILGKVLGIFAKRGVTLKLKKCRFMRSSVKFLGHIVAKGHFTPDPENVSAIYDMRAPRNKTEIRSFLGRINFYSRFVPMLSEVAEPIISLTKGKGNVISWTEGAQRSFEKLKLALCSSPILHFPVYGNPFSLAVRVGNTSIASVLEQKFQGEYWPLGFHSRKLKPAEVNYSKLEKEALAIVSSLDHFHNIVYGMPITIHSSHHSLEYLRGLKSGNSRISNWILRMLESSPEFVKGDNDRNMLPSLLCHEEDMPGAEEEPRIYVDGSCLRNGTNGASAGVGVYCEGNGDLCMSKVFKGKQSNNRAELKASIAAISQAIALGYHRMELVTDSKYVMENVRLNLDRWKENGWMNHRGKEVINMEEFKEIAQLLEHIKVNWDYVPAHTGVEGNIKADALAVNAAKLGINENILNTEKSVNSTTATQSHATMDNLDVLLPDESVIETCIDYEDKKQMDQGAVKISQTSCLVAVSEDCHDERVMVDLDYTTKKIKSSQQNDQEIKRITETGIERGSSSWEGMGVKTYTDARGLLMAKGTVSLNKNKKITIDSVYMPTELRNGALNQIHENEWTVHPGFFTFCERLLESYFWPHFRSDVRSHIRYCDKCQRMREVRRKAPTLDFEKPTGPWQMVSADIMGPLIESESGNKYILSVIDSFTRFVTLIPLEDQSAESVVLAYEKGYISRFGCPRTILTDNGSNFTSKMFEIMCRSFGIAHRCTTPWHPQTNGLVERSNREVKKKLVYLCNNASRKWDEKIHLVEFSLNNSYSTTMNASPSELLYGTNMRLPASMGGDETEEWGLGLNTYRENLKSRIQFSQRVSHGFEKDIRRKRNRTLNLRRSIKSYDVGDKVLYRRVHRGKTKNDGFVFKYEGPYIIVRRVSGGTYIINNPKDNDGLRKNITTHVDRIKEYVEDGSASGGPESRIPEYDKDEQLPNNDREADQVVKPAIELLNDHQTTKARGHNTSPELSDIGAEVRNLPHEVSNPLRVVDSKVDPKYFTRSKGKVGSDVFDGHKFDRAGWVVRC